MLLSANVTQWNGKKLCRFYSRSLKIIKKKTPFQVKEVDIFCVKNKPIFPGLLHVFNVETSIANRFTNCQKENIYVGVFFSKEEKNDTWYDDERYKEIGILPETKEKGCLRKDIDIVKDRKEIYEQGCLGLVKKVLEEESGEWRDNAETEKKHTFPSIDNVKRIVIDAKEKIRIKRWKRSNTCAEIEIIRDPTLYVKDCKHIKTYQLELINKIKEIININKRYNKEYTFLLKYYDLQKMNHLIHFVGNTSISNRHMLQNMLEEENMEKKLQKCLEIVNEDANLLQMGKELQENLNVKFLQEKKELLIKEYINNLKQKIGQKTEQQMYDTFLKKYEKIKEYICEEGQNVITRELHKFYFLSESTSNEYSSTYHYLNTVMSIPFGKYARLNTNISECEKILNRNHYRMEKAKRRVLEYACMHLLSGQVKPKILLLVGYPGVGKTTFAKSMAEGLHLPCDVIHMNTLFSLNELVGHRKTYVNSYEGKIMHSLITTNCMNPVIILDEFDKIAFTNFSIFNVFLNVFDSHQNTKFKDLYIDIPVDISNIFFICTANNVDNIPDVLLNRMEIVNLAPYTDIEKVHIFKKYMKHKMELETRIGDSYLQLSDQLLLHIIHNYTNENGLRQFYNIINSIYRRRAYYLLKGNKNLILLNPNNLPEFLNADIVEVRTNGIFPSKAAGVVTSLAFTETGGQMITIEVCAYHPSSSITSGNHPYGNHLEDFTCKNKIHFMEKNVNEKHNMLLNNPNEISFSEEKRHKDIQQNDCNNFHRNNFCLKEETKCFSTPALLTNYKREIDSPFPTSNFEKKRKEYVLAECHNEETFANKFQRDFQHGEMNTTVLNTNVLNTEQVLVQSCGTNKKDEPLDKNPNSNGSILITGNVGKVMEESILIANTYATNVLNHLIPNFQKKCLHIHLSESEIKKDGPSAGINFATAIFSYYLNIPVDNLLTMTGEITLHGHILRIGGLIEKFIIAKNYKMQSIIIPKDNKYEYETVVPDYMKNISVHFVQHYSQVFNFLFRKRNKQ